ncbi:MAG: carboxypeptidase regulatory-like domain-containing protein [Xylophilus ampelinus]
MQVADRPRLDASLAKAVASRADLVTSATLDQEVKALLATLRPLLGALGLSTLDPISGALVADGTGHDKVLDAIAVSVRPDGTAANIEITVKAQPSAADAAPLSVVLRTDATTVPVLPSVTSAQLAAVVSPTMVADLFSRITACYALPASQRVRNGNDTGSVPGTGVLASACRTLFLGDDPTSYLSNGNTVGGGAFGSMFRGSSTGLKWERGNLEFVRSNGDLVLSYRWTDTLGNSDYDTLIARNVNGTLKLTGNGYRYAATIRPYSEDRTLINTPAFSSFTTGYNIGIPNLLNAQGNSLFSKVVVTTPFNTQLTYKPSPGLSSLVLVNASGGLSGTPVYRLAATYQNSATAGNPVDKETGFVIANPQFDEAALRAIQDQSVWKLEFFHVDTQVNNVTQSHRTLSRAQTLAEIRQIDFVDVTAAMRGEMIEDTKTSVSGNYTFGPVSSTESYIDFSATGDAPAWTVPQGALAPTSLIVYGRAPTVNNVQGTRFNDSVNVPSSARKAKIYCSMATVSDPHCAPGMPNLYAQGTTFNMFELWVRNKSQVEISKKIATYKLQ